MKFWSNVEKEYNELFGDGQEEDNNENPEETKMESDFNNMFSDIKKDLKNVPKGDLLPGLSPIPENSDTEDEDGGFDEEDTKKALKIGNTKKKKDKRCRVGEKSYEVGERWKDPKTGKDMICILMNIPKDVQPRLAEADVTITKDEGKPETKKPDLKPKKSRQQWAYTNKQPKNRGGCGSDKESEKPDKVGSEADKDETNPDQEEQADDSDGDIQPIEGLNLLNKEDAIADNNETQEEQTGEEAGNSTGPSEKDSDTREQDSKESDENSEDKPFANDVTGGRLQENDNIEGDNEESESDTDSEEERRQAAKESQDADDESEYEEREEDKLKREHESKHPEIKVTSEDRETATVKMDEPEKTKDSTGKRTEDKADMKEKDTTEKESKANMESNTLDIPPSTEGLTTTQERGNTIYTKETTVTHRKLFKTEETVESVETERNVN